MKGSDFYKITNTQEKILIEIVVYNLDTYSVSLVYLALLHPSCQHLPSLLPAQEGWNTVVDAHRVSACSKVGTVACGRASAVGPGLQEHFLIPSSFPHSHYSGNSAGNCVEDPCDVDSIYDGYRPVTCAASTPFSPSTTSNFTVSPSPTLRRYFLGLFFMAVWCTNTPSLVSFLLMKPYLFLTLNHFTVPKTFVAMTFLSLLAGAADVRPLLPMVPSLVLAVLRAGAAGGCWVSTSLLVVAVMVTGAGCWGVMVTRLLPGCDGN
ncbi:unnamed protein product [Nyctereutes procyonoides]|uniref:(raccoon dog) hypothetical protein n=1 Tax=Nyctereutes procyonoides TaxID=34880 RepID=A0A811YZK8_NYCPR|nr:unnamed protein product [Nyctereutes procyonoides]